MGEILPDGTIQGYSNYCPKCHQSISVNAQGNELGKHNCMSTPHPPKGITLKLLGVPLAKQSARFRIVKPKIVKQFVSSYQPKEQVDNTRNLQWDIKSQLPRDFKPFDCPLQVTVLFVFPPLKSWSKAEKQAFKYGIVYKDTKPDLTDNLFKAVGDAMSGLVYIDDARICKSSLEKIYGDVPRIELTVCPIDKVEPFSLKPLGEIIKQEEKRFTDGSTQTSIWIANEPDKCMCGNELTKNDGDFCNECKNAF